MELLRSNGEIVTQLKEINSGVPEGSIGPMLYVLYTADLPVCLCFTTATYADDTAVLAAHNNHIEASSRLQESLHHIQRWFKKWRIKANKISIGDIYYPKRDVSTSNTEWLKNTTSWRCQIFITLGSQAKLEKTYIY